MKGISPLIASVLLIAFTISVSMIVMGWFNTFTKTTTENVSSTAIQSVSCSNAGINIEHVYVTGTSASFIVKNSGSTSIQITGSIINSTGGMCSSSTATLTQGNITSLTLSGCGPAGMGGSSCPEFSKAIVTTSCGGIDDIVTSTSEVTCSIS